MRNNKIRVAVVGAMLVLSIGAATPSQAARPAATARGERQAARFAGPLFTQLGDLLVAWTENLIGLAPGNVAHRSEKTTSQGAGTSAPRTAEATSSSTDRSAAIDPWGVR